MKEKSGSTRTLHSSHLTIITDLDREEMISMFEFPLRRTYELLGDQLQKAKRVKKVNMKVISGIY